MESQPVTYIYNNNTTTESGNCTENVSDCLGNASPPINPHFMVYHYLWTVATPVIFGLITVIGIIGNCLVIHVITSRKSMRTVTNYLLLNLAVADLSFLIICVPSTAARYVLYGWPFGEAFCKILNYSMYVCIYVTIYTLVVISLYRFLTVVCYTRFQSIRTKKSIVVVIIILWITMLSVNIPMLLIHKVNQIQGFVYCGLISKDIGRDFQITFFVFGYLLPLMLIFVLYLLILYYLKANNSSTIDQKNSKERAAHACKIVTTVVVVFGLSWLPLHINFLVNYFGTVPDGVTSGLIYEIFRVFCHCIAYGNSCANPIIYNFVSTDFRKAFKEAICVCSSSKFGKENNKRSLNRATEQTHMIPCES